MVKKFKKLKYSNDKKFSKLIDLAENSIEQFKKDSEKIIPIRVDYVKKRDIYRSALYSINGPSQLMHADIANLQFLGKSAATLTHALLVVYLCSSKVLRLSFALLKTVVKIYE